MSEKKAILVVGAGDATGGAIARRFAREGYIACVTRRHADKLVPLVARIEAEGGSAHAFGSDARKEDEVIALFALSAELGLPLTFRGQRQIRARGVLSRPAPFRLAVPHQPDLRSRGGVMHGIERDLAGFGCAHPGIVQEMRPPAATPT